MDVYRMIGDRILLKCEYYEVVHEVHSVQISTLLADKKTIGIAIGKSVEAKDIRVGSVVCADSGEQRCE